MKYKLASSSTEEGEIQEDKFPYYKSHLQFYYYPLSTKFIGKNTVPNVYNYKSEGVCLKLKKDIKSDYPYIPFNLLDNNKPFFENKFKLICEMTQSKDTIVSFLGVKSDYNEIRKLDLRSNGDNRYDKFFQKFFFRKEEESSFIIGQATKVFCLEDRVLEYLDNKNAFIFLRVCEDQRNGVIVKKYAFEDVFFNSVKFYEFLEIFQESLVKSHNGEEIRTFANEDALFFVFSSTIFKKGKEIKRIFSTIDEPKNTKIIFNKSGPVILPIQGQLSKNENYLYSLDLPEGDYAINDKKVYKVCNDGERFGYSGLQYEDFVKNVWGFNN